MEPNRRARCRPHRRRHGQDRVQHHPGTGIADRSTRGVVGDRGAERLRQVHPVGSGRRHPASHVGGRRALRGPPGRGRRPRDASADRVRRTSRRRGHPRALRGARRGAHRQALHARPVDADVRRGRPPARGRSARTRGVRRSGETPARDLQPGRTPTGVVGPGAVRPSAAPACSTSRRPGWISPVASCCSRRCPPPPMRHRRPCSSPTMWKRYPGPRHTRRSCDAAASSPPARSRTC